MTNENTELAKEERIRQYVFGELTSEENQRVAADIKRDEESKVIEARYRRTQAVLMNGRAAELDHQYAIRRKNRLRRWGAVVTTVIICLMASVVYFQSQQYSNQAIAQRYMDERFEADPQAGVVEDADRYVEARKAYSKASYMSAKELFSGLKDSEVYADKAYLYLPHISFRLEEHQAAEATFKALLADYGDLLKPNQRMAVKWNQLMNQLAQDKTIDHQLDDQGWDAEKVNALKGELQSFWRFE